MSDPWPASNDATPMPALAYTRPTIPPDEPLRAMEESVAALGEALRTLGGADPELLHRYVSQMETIAAIVAAQVAAMQQVVRQTLDVSVSITSALQQLPPTKGRTT